MCTFPERGFSAPRETPLPPMLSPSHVIWGSQEAVQQHRGYSLPWEHGPHLSDQTGHGFGSYTTIIDTGSPWEYQSQYSQYSLSDMPRVPSPDQLTTPSGPAFPPQNDLATRTTGYDDRTGSYFVSNPNCPQYPVRHYKRQHAKSNREADAFIRAWEAVQLSVPGPVPSPPPPGQPTHPCTMTEGKRKRQTDLGRHRRTSKKHLEPTGPAGPEPGCTYTEKVTRADNFKSHCKRQHTKNDKEFIRAWEAVGGGGV